NCLLAVLGLLAVWTPARIARAELTQGKIEGIVSDADTGKPVSGATVVATELRTGTEVAEITSESGRYDLPALPAGTYDVRAFFSNHTVQRPQVRVGAGQTLRVNFKIKVSEAKEEVVVVKESAPTIDVGSSRVGTKLNKDYLENMPLGRD